MLSCTQNQIGSTRPHFWCQNSNRPSTQVSGRYRICQQGSECNLQTGGAHRWGICPATAETNFNCSDIGKFINPPMLPQVPWFWHFTWHNLEHIYWATWWRFRYLANACGQLHAQVWAWCMEVTLHTPTSHTQCGCAKWNFIGDSRWKVR